MRPAPLRTSMISFAVLSLAAASCGKAPADFTASERASQGEGCTVETTTRALRILVMVDNSGSTDKTDPSQAYRVQTLRTFLADYGSHANLSYGFGYFDDDAYLYDANGGRFTSGSASLPFGSAATIAAALDTYHASIPPAGNTGYGAAFGALRSAIAQDEASGQRSDYAVVFMSDGQPTDVSGNVPSAITNLVRGLRGVAETNGKSHLSVSAVYFGPATDATSISNLRGMAAEGAGQFVDTNHLSAGGLAIDDVVTIPGC